MYKRILVPLDGSHTAKRGLEEAIRLAKAQKARLCLIHVVDQSLLVQYPEAGMYTGDLTEVLEQEGRRIIENAQAEVRARGLKSNTVLYKSPARIADVVVRHARKWHADLIVLGTHGRRGVNRILMGSDAELIVRASPVPVLLVRSAAPKRRKR